MQLWYYKYLPDSEKVDIAYQVWHGLIDPDKLDADKASTPLQLERIKFAKDCKRQMVTKEF